MDNKIDFVVTWVDGNDENWRKQKESFFSGGSQTHTGTNRYRDWDLMKYWFRGVERFAPWVNNIYFITCGHLPQWLNVNHPKLRIISHREYMPETALPTFNSNAIELGIHKIKGLSEQFVLFNDDMFLIDNVEPTVFFKNGLPCDYAALDSMEPGSDFWHIILNDLILINQNFSMRECLREIWKKWYSLKDIRSTIRTIKLSRPWGCFMGFYDYHITIAYLKSEFEEVWERYPEELSNTIHHRFRENGDVSHWLFRYWRLAKGQFSLQSQRYGIRKGISNEKKIMQAIDIIKNQKKKVICVNDVYEGEQFERVKTMIQESFESILPVPSDFEIQG